MNLWWWILYRFYATRTRRARHAARSFEKKAEKFFHKVNGVQE